MEGAAAAGGLPVTISVKSQCVSASASGLTGSEREKGIGRYISGCNARLATPAASASDDDYRDRVRTSPS